MTHIHNYLFAYSIWVAFAAVFGLRRYTNTGCEVTERYFEEDSHRWARIVAIVMMVAVEFLYWRPLSQLWILWKMEEETIFFNLIFLAFFAYGHHRVFWCLVGLFENMSYDRAEDFAEGYCKNCEKCCRRAGDGFTELPDCPLKGYAKACPCLEAGYDIRDVNYTSEVMEAISKVQADYRRRGIAASTPISIRVPNHRVVCKKNPYDDLFRDRWEFDIKLDGIDLFINEETKQTAKIINFPATAVVHAPEPEEAKIEQPAPRRHEEAYRLLGQHGSFSLHLRENGVTCHIARDLPDAKQFRREVLIPDTTHYESLKEFMHSKEGQLLLAFINVPTLTEQQIAKLG